MLLAGSTGDSVALKAHAAAATRLARAGGGLRRLDEIVVWARLRCAIATGNHDDAGLASGAVQAAGPPGLHRTIQVLATPDLVEAAVLSGNSEWTADAREAFDCGADDRKSPPLIALSDRCRGLVAHDVDEAISWYKTALERYRRFPLEFEQARTQLLLGRALRRARHPAEARDHLRNALAVFERMALPAWLDQVRSELRVAGGLTGTPDTQEPWSFGLKSAALTRRHIEIAELVVMGATNKEIATRLFVSARTIDHHLRNVSVSLGVRSRAELVRIFGGGRMDSG
jgi:DNA-binding CsgD family transcriptional regulator